MHEGDSVDGESPAPPPRAQTRDQAGPRAQTRDRASPRAQTRDQASPPARALPQVRGLLVYLVVAALSATAGAGTTLAVQHSAPSRPIAVRAPNDPSADRPATMNDEAVYDEVEPGIVDVTGNLTYLQETAEGTGFVIDAAAGLVLTNNHVIDGAISVMVTPVTSGRSYQARILGYDATDDVALLQVRGVPGLTAVAIGDSARLTVGTPVLAIGNEAGQGGPPTVAPGVISGLGRTIVATDQTSGLTETLHGMLQTSADIRPGDSGGPLADAAGRVVGIDTAAGGGTVYSGYAIPVNQALPIARRIAAGRAGARVQIGLPAFLGVLVADSTSPDPRQQASQQLRQTGTVSSSGRACTSGATTAVPASIAPARSGVLVDGVLCGTAAAAAGLVAGDVITSLGGRAVTSPGSLTALVSRYRPGGRAPVTWVSPGGRRHAVTVTLGAGPAG